MSLTPCQTATKSRVLEHSVAMSGTSDRMSVEPSSVEEGGCPCGRYHPPAGRRRAQRRDPQDPVALGDKILQATFSGKATALGGGFFEVAYHGDCAAPLRVCADDARSRHVAYYVRCRKCGACRRAKRNYWGFAATNVTKQTMNNGLRTWFGTLTLSPEWQCELLRRARDKHPDPHAPWWSEPRCDERFSAVRKEMLHEVQKFWKRLRSSGKSFQYLLVFEQHKSGLPHAHFLLHEKGGPILKRELRDQWPCGFLQSSLVGGRARNAATPDKAAWYAVKYVTKSAQARLVASLGYGPEKRSNTHVGVDIPPHAPPRARARRRNDDDARARACACARDPRACGCASVRRGRRRDDDDAHDVFPEQGTPRTDGSINTKEVV